MVWKLICINFLSPAIYKYILAYDLCLKYDTRINISSFFIPNFIQAYFSKHFVCKYDNYKLIYKL